MDWKVWCQNISEYEEVKDLLIDLLEKLISEYCPNAGDYVQEKFVKSFVEPIGLLERNLQYQRGMHHSQLERKDFILKPNEKEKLIKDTEEIKIILNVELRRQYRHYCIFLSSMRS